MLDPSRKIYDVLWWKQKFILWKLTYTHLVDSSGFHSVGKDWLRLRTPIKSSVWINRWLDLCGSQKKVFQTPPHFFVFRLLNSNDGWLPFARTAIVTSFLRTIIQEDYYICWEACSPEKVSNASEWHKGKWFATIRVILSHGLKKSVKKLINERTSWCCQGWALTTKRFSFD